MALTDADRAALLRRARGALEERLCGEPFEDRPETARLRERAAAFVSIYTLGGELRGCRGRLVSDEPLGTVVEEIAVSTALHDPRFPAVTCDELARVKLVVQVLTPRRRVAAPEEIVLGRHGIVLTKRGRSAVFLPNVATDLGWDLETTLSHLAMKAGFAPDDWREGVTFEVFESEIVREDDSVRAPPGGA
jgi:AmmeMemoRadiSam system protein A